MTRFFDWLKRWVADVVSTNLTIVTGLIEGMVYVIWALAAATWGTPIDENTLDTVGLFIMGQITGGVVQFAVKRNTDHKLHEVKAQARQTVTMPAVTP